MKLRYLLILAIAVFLGAGCASTSFLTPTQVDADRGAKQFQGYTLSELTEGKKLYEQHCGSCHKLIAPKKESSEAWQKIVPDMVKKVNKKEQKLNAQQETLILRYVLTMCKVGKKS